MHASWDERSVVVLLRLPAEPPFAGGTATAEGRAAIGERLAAALAPRRGGGRAWSMPRAIVSQRIRIA